MILRMLSRKPKLLRLIFWIGILGLCMKGEKGIFRKKDINWRRRKRRGKKW